MSKPLWSGRFDSAPDPAAFDFGVSFPFDRRLFEDDVTGSLAWAEALARAGVLDASDTRAIVDGLTAILEQGRRDPSWVNGDDEDVHSFVERQLVARIGDAGRRSAHRPIAQRTGVGRSAAVPPPPNSAAAGKDSRRDHGVCRSGGEGRRCA